MVSNLRQRFQCSLPLTMLLWPAILVASPQPETESAVSLFKVAPALCVAQEDAPCHIRLRVAWHHAAAACLYRTDNNVLLGCGQTQQLDLNLTLNANLTLELRTAADGALLQQKVIRRMQQLKDSEALTPRRLSWSLF